MPLPSRRRPRESGARVRPRGTWATGTPALLRRCRPAQGRSTAPLPPQGWRGASLQQRCVRAKYYLGHPALGQDARAREPQSPGCRMLLAMAASARSVALRARARSPGPCCQLLPTRRASPGYLAAGTARGPSRRGPGMPQGYQLPFPSAPLPCPPAAPPPPPPPSPSLKGSSTVPSIKGSSATRVPAACVPGPAGSSGRRGWGARTRAGLAGVPAPLWGGCCRRSRAARVLGTRGSSEGGRQGCAWGGSRAGGGEGTVPSLRRGGRASGSH